MKFNNQNSNLSIFNKIGIIINFLGSAAFLSTGIYLLVVAPSQQNYNELVIISLFLILGSLLTIMFTFFYWMYQDNKSWRIWAGFFGIFFGAIVGGGLIFLKDK